MHEEDYAKKEHGHATASLGDDGEGLQIIAWDFIWRSLQRSMKKTTTLRHVHFHWLSAWFVFITEGKCWYWGEIRQLSVKSGYYKRSRTNKMAKNVRCEHLHVMFLPVVNVSHPLSVQLGRLPMIRDRSRNCRVHKWGTYQRLDYQASHKSVLSNIYNQFVLKLQKKTQFKPVIMFMPLNVPVMMLTYLHRPRNCNVEFLPVNKTAKLDSEGAI